MIVHESEGDYTYFNKKKKKLWHVLTIFWVAFSRAVCRSVTTDVWSVYDGGHSVVKSKSNVDHGVDHADAHRWAVQIGNEITRALNGDVSQTFILCSMVFFFFLYARNRVHSSHEIMTATLMHYRQVK